MKYCSQNVPLRSIKIVNFSKAAEESFMNVSYTVFVKAATINIFMLILVTPEDKCGMSTPRS